MTGNWDMGGYEISNLELGSGISWTDSQLGGNHSLNDIGEFNGELLVQSGNMSDINATIASCTLDMCKVTMPCGNYNLSELVHFRANLDIGGEGSCTIVNIDTGYDGFLCPSGTDCSNLTIHDFVIDGGDNGWVSEQPSVVYVSGRSRDVEMYGMTIRNYNEKTGASFNSSNVTVRDNKFLEGRNGVSFIQHSTSECDSIKVLDNDFITSYNSANPTEFGEGVEVNSWGCGSAIVQRNKFKGYREQSIDINIEYSLVSFNDIEMVIGETRGCTGIMIMSTGGDNARAIVTNNNIWHNSYNTDTAINLADESNTSIIKNNLIIGRGTSGGGRGIRIGTAGGSAVGFNIMSNLEWGIYDKSTDLQSQIFANVMQNVDQPFTADDNTFSMYWNFDRAFIPSSVTPTIQNLIVTTLTATDINGANINDADLSGTLVLNDENIYGFWAFEESSGTIVYDDENENDGEFVGDTKRDNGKLGNAIYLDGSGDYITTEMPQITVSQSISMWLKGDENEASYSDNLVLFYTNCTYISIRGSAVRFGTGHNSVSTYTLGSTEYQKWHHVLGTYDGTNTRIYIDGVLRDTDTHSLVCSGHSETIIGDIGGNSDSGSYYKGWVDDVKVWNNTLSSQEVYGEFLMGLASHPPTGHLLEKSGGTMLGETHFNNTVYIKPNEKVCWNENCTMYSYNTGVGRKECWNLDCTAYEEWNGTHKIEDYP